MEEIKIYKFSEQEFRQMEKLADDIYNTGVVLKSFCKQHSDIEEVANILSVLENSHKKADTLNCIFINFES